MNEKERLNKNTLPAFHITGKAGWINDPNGLVVFQNRYHAFFQYHPHSLQWGPMHWGHVVSDDLVHWETLPIALYPGEKGIEDGCFSGTAIVWQDKLWLLYTGFTENGGGENVRQLQCLASSDDGIHFTKHGVVIGEKELPEAYAPWDFRDPKVWRKDGWFWCLVAGKKRDGRGRILMFRSKDLFSWTFVGDLFGEDSLGIMIECPDYNEEQGLLFCCEQFQPQEGSTHLNVHSTRWYKGELDYENGRFTVEKKGIIDYGFDFYAPQSFAETDVLMAWLNMWDREIPSRAHGFAGMLTVPRTYAWKDGDLHQEPVIQGETAVCQEVNGTLLDSGKIGVLRITAEHLRAFRLALRKKDGQQTTLTLQGNEWVFDRSLSGQNIVGVEKDEDSLAGIRRMPFKKGEKTEIVVVMDEFSVEIFADGKALSATIYPDLDAEGIALEVDADACQYVRETV